LIDLEDLNRRSINGPLRERYERQETGKQRRCSDEAARNSKGKRNN